MLDLFSPGRSLAWDFAWQATAFLVLGTVASLMLARRPARAHRALLLAMIAGLVTPLLGQAVRHLELGLLAPGVGGTTAVTITQPLGALTTQAPRRRSQRSADLQVRGAEVASSESEPVSRRLALPARFTPRSLALGAWVVLTLAAAARLAASLVLGVRVAARARRVDDPALLKAAAAACDRLGLGVQPEVFASARLRCPVIWCWGRRPKLIVPAAAAGDIAIDWVAVLSHELAHWVRRDHLAALAGEVFACILPWHPLAWWAKSRMSQVAELACDDWVLASGQAAAEYAAALLGLMPQGHAPLAQAAVSTRGGLAGRVRRILADVRREPRAGRRWTALALAATVLAAAAIALVQSRPAPVAAAQADVPETKAARADLAEQVVSGRILLPDGRPAAGATVDWSSYASSPAPTGLDSHSLPKHMPEGRDGYSRLRVLGRASADAEGRFRIVARFAPEEIPETALAVRMPGTALLGRSFWANDRSKDLTLTLAPAVTIEGRLLTPAGVPASGVTVDLAGFSIYGGDGETRDGVHVDLDRPESERPGYWPRTMTTGADGRFILAGMVPTGTFASFHFRHPDYADDDVTVSTGPAATEGLRAFDIQPVAPKFVHTLEPARPVEGVVTAQDDGRPIAGATVEVIPMRSPSGETLFTTTDAEGRYRVAGQQADTYYVHVYPPPGSAYIAATRNHRGWPEGAKVLTLDLALTRGKLFHGTVVDADTRQPIAGASVVYQPKRGNPNRRNNQEFRNPVLSDANGRFTIAGLGGTGHLLVEEGSLDYIRGTISGKEAGNAKTLYPHGFAEVEVAATTEPAPVEIALRKGKTLEARVLGPDGRPLPSVTAWCPELTFRQLNHFSALNWFDGGLFKLPGAEPGRTYRVLFLQKELRLAAVAKLTLAPKADGRPLEVKLQPTATIKGMAVNKDGTPALGVQIYPVVVLTEDMAPLKERDFYDEDKADLYAHLTQDMSAHLTTTAEFNFTNLIPGIRYYVTIARTGGTTREVRAPKPGEVIDLGKIVVEDKRPQ